jgi:hypothetical protein
VSEKSCIFARNHEGIMLALASIFILIALEHGDAPNWRWIAKCQADRQSLSNPATKTWGKGRSPKPLKASIKFSLGSI